MTDRWDEISKIYHAALELRENERANFLASSVEDVEIRMEVESLLASSGNGDAFLESPAIEIAAKSMAKELQRSLLGRELGNYRIVSLLGTGGMGEIFRAKDRKLGRDVAIKILPEEFASDKYRAASFRREAMLLASLNHPNIAAIHGLEKFEGIQFLVLEFAEGMTLADRLKHGPVPIDEALKISVQIARALEAAHEKEIIHRDLKPANIVIATDVRVKVLDFGLAKALGSDSDDITPFPGPIFSPETTEKGIILGTTAYMSPEQAKGKPADKRSDIWAFGVVLYEMLTGCPLFAAETTSETLAGVLAKDIRWDIVPPRLFPLLHRCLQRDPNDRFRNICDVRLDLEDIMADRSHGSGMRGRSLGSRLKPRRALQWLIGSILLSILAGIAGWNLKRSPPLQVVRLHYDLNEGQHFSDFFECELAISPDGSKIVYGTTDGLYLQPIGEPAPRLIPGTGRNSMRPFFSPDGQWIGYSENNVLKKIALRGGAPKPLLSESSVGSFLWGPDDTILCAAIGQGILRVPSDGGPPSVIVKSDLETVASPYILPDAHSILFTYSHRQQFKIFVQSLETGQRKELIDGAQARYLPTGHLVFSLGNDLYAARFNKDKVELEGEPHRVMEGVYRAMGSTQYAVSNSGTLIYMPETSKVAAGDRCSLVWVDRKGKEEPLMIAADNYRGIKISPDGTRVALAVQNNVGMDIWTWDIKGKSLDRLTSSEGDSSAPLWTPDGKFIVFSSIREDSHGPASSICRKSADGMGKVQILESVQKRFRFPWSWSHDGKSLIVQDYNMSGSFDIGYISIGEQYKFSLLLQGEHDELQPQVSPDGRWLAYVSNELGQQEVYVRPFPDVTAGWWQISTAGGTSPLWSPDGRKLYYRSGNSVVAVSVQTNPSFKKAGSEVLFQGSYVHSEIGRGVTDPNTWDISPDGERFLMLKRFDPAAASADAPRRIEVVINWFEELKKLIPQR